MKSTQGPVTRGVSQLSMLGQILFNIFCSNLDDVAEFTLSKFADNAKMRGVADTPEIHAATERNLEKLEKLGEEPHGTPRRGITNPLQ